MKIATTKNSKKIKHKTIMKTDKTTKTGAAMKTATTAKTCNSNNKFEEKPTCCERSCPRTPAVEFSLCKEA